MVWDKKPFLGLLFLHLLEFYLFKQKGKKGSLVEKFKKSKVCNSPIC